MSTLFIRALAVAVALVLPWSAVVRSQELTTIRVAAPPNDDFKSVYYGIRAGIFKRYGLDVQATLVNSGSAAIAGVVGGSLQVALTSLPAVFQAHLRGIPIKIAAPAHVYLSEKPTEMLVVGRDSAIKSGHDFNGKTIGSLSLRDLNATATFAWIDQNGGDSKTVKTIELPGAAVIAALEDGRIVGATLSAPFIDDAVTSGKARLFAKSYDAIGKRFLSAAFVASNDFITANTDAMTRFARAMRECTAYTNTHLAETVDLVASYSGVDAAVIAKSHRMIDAETVDPRMIQPVIDTAAKYGMIDRPFSAEEIIASTVLRPGR